MDKLTDPNPYEILDIPVNAGRQEIKKALAEKQRTSESRLDRQNARNARQTLSRTSKRLVVDALLPDFISNASKPEIEFVSPEPIDVTDVVDVNTVIAHDIELLLIATINHQLGDISPPQSGVDEVQEFDNLDKAIAEWINE
jgi:hypothetical protein